MLKRQAHGHKGFGESALKGILFSTHRLFTRDVACEGKLHSEDAIYLQKTMFQGRAKIQDYTLATDLVNRR